jgi:hypothetical protein
MGSTDTVTILQPRVELADPHVSGDNKDRLSVLAAIYEPPVSRATSGS